VGSETLLEQAQLNFSFRNKFIILLPCGLLVNNNTFLKMCLFRSLTGYSTQLKSPSSSMSSEADPRRKRRSLLKAYRSYRLKVPEGGINIQGVGYSCELWTS